MKKYAFLLTLLATTIFFGCAEDDDKKNDNTSNITVVDTAQWIGHGCTCEGQGCKVMGVPIPAPNDHFSFTGCDNVKKDQAPGSQLTCMQTIDSPLSPKTYFPKGYCTLSATKCEGIGMCPFVTYGDTDAMTSCPSGSTLLTSTFFFSLGADNAAITNKVCARNCHSDADCNTAGEMTCIQKDQASFCYNEKNFAFMTNGYTAKSF